MADNPKGPGDTGPNDAKPGTPPAPLAPETNTYDFDLGDVQSISVNGVSLGIALPQPPPLIHLQIVVSKPPT